MNRDVANTKFNLPVRVYYEDTDVGGIVYHSRYLNFMERARTEWFRHLGFELDNLIQQHGILFVVRSVSISYNSPALFNQLLNIETRIIKQRKVSLHFEQTILDQSEKNICQAEIMIVCINSKTMQPQLIPETILLEMA